jgi:hypothetical protein
MAYTSKIPSDPHLPVWSRDGITPFWVGPFSIATGDLDDTDVTGLYQFPDEGFILNAEDSVMIDIAGDLDSGAALRLNLVLVDSTGAVQTTLNSNFDPGAGGNFGTVQDASLPLWIDVGGLILAIEVETAPTGAQASTLNIAGEVAHGVKLYAAS